MLIKAGGTEWSVNIISSWCKSCLDQIKSGSGLWEIKVNSIICVFQLNIVHRESSDTKATSLDIRLCGLQSGVSTSGRSLEEQLAEAVSIRDLLKRNTEETEGIIRALNGEYILPEAGGDLLRDGAGVLPTGDPAFRRCETLVERQPCSAMPFYAFTRDALQAGRRSCDA